MSYLKDSYNLLTRVLKDGAFLNLELNALMDENRAIVTKIAYGFFDKYYELEAIVKALTKNAPRPQIRIILMQAIYAIRYMSIPHYAIVNESVELVKGVKKPLAGFVNAVLKSVVRGEYTITQTEEVRYNYPLWVIDIIKTQYPDKYEEILTARLTQKEHVRLNGRVDRASFEREFETEPTQTGYYVKVDDRIKEMFKRGDLTFQSYTSTLVVETMGDVKGKKILDMCAAPGGKSVYLAQKGAFVIAAELYPHRIRLIDAYQRRMGVKLECCHNDAMVYRGEWQNAFDVVLLDAPCSGLGVLSKRPDIMIKRQKEDIDRLALMQGKMLENAAKYVKRGGLLVYSTCTLTNKENVEVVNGLLACNDRYLIEDMQEFLPTQYQDGYFIAKLRKS